MLQKNCIYILYACALIPFVVFQSLNCVQLFVNPWTAACQASLSFTISQRLLKLMSIELVMPSRHLGLSSPSSPAFNLSQHQSLFQSVGYLHQVAKVLELQLQYQYFQWVFRVDWLISSKTDWFDLPAVQGTLKSLLQHDSSKTPILWCSAFFMVYLSQSYVTSWKTIWTLISKVMSFLFNILSRFVIAFLPISNHLLVSWLLSPSAVILEPKEICHCFHLSSFYFPWNIRSL